MPTFRTFRNTDPPLITSLWRSRAGQPGLLQPLRLEVLEQLVFAKLYFEHAGLIIAEEDGRSVGFAHAGFGPNAARTGISTDLGVISMVLTRPDCNQEEVAAGLVAQCEQYLIARGAKVIQGGGVPPESPFYVGLYGGGQTPGVLDVDACLCDVYRLRGYEEVARTVIWQRDLIAFEAPIDRRQMEIRRRMVVELQNDVRTHTWWDSCTWGEFELTRFEIKPRGSTQPVAWAVFRHMEPIGSTGASKASGLVELFVEEAYRHRGVALFLLCEACRQFAKEGVMSMETQVPEENPIARKLFVKLGFRQSGLGHVFRKAN